MSWELLRQKYGKGRGPQLLNRVIRAELIGGPQVLDALESLNAAQHALGKRGMGHDEVSRALTAATAARDALAEEICRRYGIGE